MRRALRVAENGMACGEMPIGAVVAVDGEIVAESHTEELGRKRLLVHADLLLLRLPIGSLDLSGIGRRCMSRSNRV